MILYFSGTGNTKYCATKLAELLGEEMTALTVSQLRYPDKARINIKDKRVIWMFPTYSWGIPKHIAKVLKKASINMPAEAVNWMVTTCGDDIGNTAKQWRRLIERQGYTAATAFSVQMPNTYTFMKGFDVDSEELVKVKLFESKATIENIARVISKGKTIEDQVTRGSNAWFKSAIIYPLFNKFYTSSKPFYANEKCTDCGLCMRSCPMENLAPGENKRPRWLTHCMLCSRCYHICPKHAVQYGKKTANKGQYICNHLK